MRSLCARALRASSRNRTSSSIQRTGTGSLPSAITSVIRPLSDWRANSIGRCGPLCCHCPLIGIFSGRQINDPHPRHTIIALSLLRSHNLASHTPPMMLIPCLSAFRIHTLGVDCVRKMASQSILHVVCVCINRIGTVDSVTAPRLCARCVQGAAINSPGPAFAVAATLGAPVGKGIAEAKLAIHPSCASGTRFAWSANSGQSAGFQ